MLSNRRDRVPRGAVRDLLGIARALYRAELAAGGNPVRLQELADVGHMLHEALDLSKGEPDTMGHRAAWSWAEKGARALGAYLATHEVALAGVVRASAARLHAG